MSKINLNDLTEEQLTAALEQKRKAKESKAAEVKKQYRKNKEVFCETTAQKFDELHKLLKSLKEATCSSANELYERMYEIAGKEPKPTKSFTLKNEADTIKVVIDRQERFEFTPEAIVHINAIRDIFKAKFSERNKAMYSILDGLLVKNSKMEYDPKLLAKARRQVRDLGDTELINEFDKLDECQHVTGSALYCRLYRRSGDGKWQDISLQFSAL
ncbi:DUF3164 family protein [Rubritalea spongiae]|uniref:DUF3164 family protein n=1 Tax=Rubritalea spongiae TaxID=430797 RepID=A0ABW5E1Z0_9BACT